MKRGLLILILLYSYITYGQLPLKQVFKEDEFNGETHYVYQDSKGYTWIGTTLGVYRYDSKKWEQYTIADGLPNNEVLRIYEDSEGRVWMTSFSDELCYYYNGKIFNQRNDTRLKGIKVFFGSPIMEVNGKLWFVSKDRNEVSLTYINKFYHFNAKLKLATSNFFTNHFHSFNNELYGIIVNYNDNRDKFVCNIEEKKIFFSKHIEKMSLYDQEYSFYQSIENTLIYNDLKLKKGYFIGSHGEYTDSFNTNAFKNHFLGKQSNKYILRDSSSIFYLDKNKKIEIINFEEEIKKNLSYKNITYFEYKKNVFYSDLKKIYNIRLLKWGDFKKINVLKNNVIVLKDKEIENITVNKSNKIENKERTEMIYNSFNYKNSVFYTSSNKLIEYNFKSHKLVNPLKNKLGTYNNKYIVNFSKSCAFKYSIIHKNNLSFSNKIGIYIPKNNIYTRINFERTNTFFIDSKERLWYSASSGNYYADDYDPIIKNPTKLLLSKKINVQIKDYAEDIKGNILLCTNNGIYIVTPQNKIYNINSKNILSSDECTKIFLDKDQTLWIATDKGLNHISYLKGSQFGYKKINIFLKTDGLTSDNINDFTVVGDSVYIATNKGINLIIDKHFLPDTTIIPIHIKSYYVTGKKWLIDTLGSLSHTQNSIQIDFSSIYYERTERMRIFYRLIHDKDTQTQEVFDTRILLQSLSPNKYKLQIYSYDRDYSYIKSNIKEIQFTIEPPFYKTWWFFLSIVLIILGVIFYIAYLYIKRQKDQLVFKNERLNYEKELSKLQLEALKAEMNPHFIFNCLNGIKDFMMQKDFEKSQYYLSTLSKLIRQALYNSKEHFVTLEDELKFIDLYVEMEQMRFSKKFDYIKNFKNFENYHIQIPTMLLQPFFENAVRHGKIGQMDIQGKLYFEISENEDEIIMKICDNGIGLKKSQEIKVENSEHKSMALDIIKDRISIYKQSYEIEIIYDIREFNGKEYSTEVLLVLKKENL